MLRVLFFRIRCTLSAQTTGLVSPLSRHTLFYIYHLVAMAGVEGNGTFSIAMRRRQVQLTMELLVLVYHR